MRKFFVMLLGCICCLCVADGNEIAVREGRDYTHIVFPEPVVSRSVVEADAEASPQERGLTLFRIEGDARHTPRAEWTDQHTLALEFPVGTSCKTQYQLIMNKEARYLGGVPITPRGITFRYRDERLVGKAYPDPSGAAVLVTAGRQISREARALSPSSGVSFEFRRVKYRFWSGHEYYGRRVAAHVEPARVCDGVMRESVKYLESLGEQAWKGLKPESVLPGHVLVRPAEMLPEGEEWALVCTGGEGVEHEEVVEFVPEYELLSGLELKQTSSGADEVELQLYFSHPLRQEALRTLFSRLQFSVEGQGTVSSMKDGQERHLVLPDGRRLRFRYAGVLPCVPRAKGLEPRAGELAFLGGRMLADGLRIRVSGHVPAVVDVAVPQGTAAANGLCTTRTNVHRIALNPAWPLVLPGNHQPTILPLHGEHKLRLPVANLSEVVATLHRVARERVADAFYGAPYDSRAYRAAAYDYCVEDERDSEDLCESASYERKHRNRKWKALVKAGKERERRLEGAVHYPARRYELKLDGLMRCGELVLDMDTLAGERLQPGLYILTLHTRPNTQVQKALLQNESKVDALNYEVDVPVLVTDINLTCSRRGLLATRFSDGSVLRDCLLTQQQWNADSRQWDEKTTPLPRGVAYMRGFWQNVIVQQGQDMALGRMPTSASYPTADGFAPEDWESTGCYLFAERSIYRPGDTVHLRGYLRRSKADKLIQPLHRKVTLRVRRPDHSVLCEQVLAVNEFGAIEAEVKLPEGEEDVVGDYYVDAEAEGVGYHTEMTVSCQVFRRDAFEATLHAELEKVAPEKLTLHVQADDYSGVPLANGRVELKIGGERHRLVTNAAGTARLELPMKPEWLQAGELSVEGSVSNDREEYVVLPAQQLSFSMADFRVLCDEGRLYLTDARSGAPLAREQQVTVRLWEEVQLPENAQALFTRLQEQEKTLTELELTVPADCREGLPLPPQLLPAQESEGRCQYTITGKDGAGREALCRCKAEKNVSATGKLRLVAQQSGQNLRLQFVSPGAGMAHLFIGCGRQLRHVQQPVQKGEQVLTIPLRERESGRVSASLVLLESASPGAVGDTAFCFVSSPEHQLEVALEMPQGVVRPGQKVQLRGQVRAKGKPAASEVTLYAVDAGMLSVGEYTRPDPEKYFYSRSVWTFVPEVPFRYCADERWPGKEERLSRRMLPAVWRGELADGGEAFLRFRPVGALPKGVESGLMTGGLRSGSAAYGDVSMEALVGGYSVAEDEMPPWLLEDNDTDGMQMVCPAPVCPIIADEAESTPAIRLRQNFEPVAVWKAALRTDAEGRFSAEAELPDTLTTYRVFAVAGDRSGARFGVAEDSFVVNLPVMISPGMPPFMSTGDSLRLPLSITNATDEAGSWTVSMSGCDTPQQIELPARGCGTLYFEVNPMQEGECTLTWQAVGKPGTDAVQGRCKVRFPAPLLKEVHHLELPAGEAPLRLASLFAPEVAQSGRAQVQVLLSANPLLHLSSVLDFLLQYPYGCTEQRASALLPWLLYDELAPFCPQMASTPRQKVQEVVRREINALFARQCEDGGLGYWEKEDVGCSWASAYAALAFTVAKERGFEVPEDKMKRLLNFVDGVDEDALLWNADMMAARALGHSRTLRRRLQEIDKQLREEEEKHNRKAGVYGANVRFLLALQNGGNADASFRSWLRTVGRDYRHATTHHSALTLLALHDYLRARRAGESTATALLQDGSTLQLGSAPVELPLPQVGQPEELPTALSAAKGKVFALVRAKAQPDKTEYPGVTERGLQVTRLYEVKGEDGVWRKAPDELKVGDVVRVTLTCAKIADELQYFVLEDYLPACMEAINPEVPSQAAGLEATEPWSAWFDHREYLADRVRGFCTRWAGRDLLNMTYYARVKRAGNTIAPPAQAQLMYEPQVYGLSPNARVKASAAPGK